VEVARRCQPETQERSIPSRWKKKQRVNAHTSGTAASVSLIRQIVGTGYLNTGVLRMPYQETRQIMQIDEESLMFRRIR
jgi:hypothetical protein